MAYTTIDNPELYFQTKLYTGNETARSITLDGSENMQPDLVWLKIRTQSYSHRIFDSVRGANKRIHPDTNEAEDLPTTALTSFDSDGFSLGNNTGENKTGDTFVAWNWKAGTSFTNDASSTGVGSIDSSGSVNTTAGFSIISWTGSGSGATIAHGIGVQPQIVFVKNRDDTASWNVYTVFGGGGKGLFLNDSAAFDSDTSYFNNGTASTTTFPVGTANTSNGSSDNMIAYCFANVKGYSKIGSYTGNGNADGTFIYTGFKPSFVMAKMSSSTGNWSIFDNKRSSFNVVDEMIKGNSSQAELADSSRKIDFNSSGFKIRADHADINTSGGTYIYMCFASSPFTTSTGIPTTAR